MSDFLQVAFNRLHNITLSDLREEEEYYDNPSVNRMEVIIELLFAMKTTQEWPRIESFLESLLKDYRGNLKLFEPEFNKTDKKFVRAANRLQKIINRSATGEATSKESKEWELLLEEKDGLEALVRNLKRGIVRIENLLLLSKKSVATSS